MLYISYFTLFSLLQISGSHIYCGISLLLLYACPVLLKVYCSDHTYTTIRVAVAATGREVICAVADKLGTTDELLLVHLTSAGGKTDCLDVKKQLSCNIIYSSIISHFSGYL